MLLKNQWETFEKYLELEDDKKLSMAHQKLNELSAFKNVKGTLPRWIDAVWPSEAKKYASQSEKNYDEMTQFIHCMNHCSNLCEFFATAVRHRYVFVIESLLDANVAVNDDVKKLLKTRNYQGHTPLIEACERNKSNLACVLIRLGSDVNAADRYGNTVLHWAVNSNMVEVVKILIKKGAKTDAKNNSRFRDTPLNWVRAKYEHGMKIEELLTGTEAENANNDKN